MRRPGAPLTSGAVLAAVVLSASGLAAQGAGTAAPPDRGALRAIVAAGRLDDLRWPDFSDYREDVAAFYEAAGYAPAWVQAAAPTAPALALIGQFRDAWKKGLDPESFDASRWEARIAELRSPNADPSRFDAAVTVCTMRLISDLRIGRIHPKHLGLDLDIEGKKYDLPRFVRERLVGASDVAAVIEAVEPPFGGYRRTEAALARYVEIAGRDSGSPLPVPAKAIRPGQPYDGAARLRELLALLGDLPADGAAAPDPGVFDAALSDAVKTFQRRHGLDDDGRLGTATVRQMNVPLAERVRQLQLTLERWRWLPDTFTAPPIIVNIPDFRLRALDENRKVALEMRVVVGKAMRHETPVFSRDMTYVVLRPYWNVPPSIRRGEIVPAIQRDRDYVAKKRYEVTTNDGKVVTDGAISDDVLAKLKSGQLAVRQKPGPANSLGLVKLMFPNQYNVYLHDTPAGALFAKSRRDFSHGCIRLEKPDELAAWVLRGSPDWPLERVRTAMQSGPDDVTVRLARPIPVFIVYATALAYENGEVHFYDDIYGHDATLARALEAGYPYR
jgi:murein L,D-transpeptidase YcbB/YkuD